MPSLQPVLSVPWLDLRSGRTPAQRSATRRVPHAGRGSPWAAAAPVNRPAWPDLGDAGPNSTARPDVAAHLGGLDDDLAALGLGRHRFFRQNAVLRKTNWKLIIDAFIEFYHIKRLHAATVGQYFADTKAAADWVGPHQRLLVARDTFKEALQLPQEQWDPRHHGTLVHFIFPNSLIVHHPDYISHMGIFPAGIDRSLFVHTMLTPELPADEKARAHWDRSFELIDGNVFNGEDLFICEQIQLGLAAAENAAFVLGRFENNVRRFHETIATSLGGG